MGLGCINRKQISRLPDGITKKVGSGLQRAAPSSYRNTLESSFASYVFALCVHSVRFSWVSVWWTETPRTCREAPSDLLSSDKLHVLIITLVYPAAARAQVASAGS